MVKIIFKRDKYKETREGRSRILSISCQKCGRKVCEYQKDNPGSLRRMYLDRILKKRVPISGKNFNCPEGHLLGIKIIYEKENRPAFRLFVDSVTKKIIKLD